MKVSREQAEANRQTVIEVAGQLFRKHGFDGIGVAEIMKEAGLTHGGFYGNFASKDDLANQVCAAVFGDAKMRWDQRLTEARAPQDALAGLLDAYLTTKHRDGPQRGCPVPSLAADVARSENPKLKRTFTRGVKALLESLTGMFGHTKARSRENAIATLSGMVGALVLSRAVDDETLSREILSITRAALLKPRAR